MVTRKGELMRLSTLFEVPNGLSMRNCHRRTLIWQNERRQIFYKTTLVPASHCWTSQQWRLAENASR
jgi:hypothetical protein